VFRRPLVVLAGLTLCDYLLWTWSLNGSLSGSRDVLALVSGLTLPLLAIASLWLLSARVARLIARSTRSRLRGAGGGHPVADRDGGHPAIGSTSAASPTDEAPASATTSSDKLAA
jgi:hypothetical protein